MEITKPAILIGVLVSILFLAALLPTIVEFIQGTSHVRLYDGNLTLGEYGWNFTGHSGAIALWLLLPLIIIAAAALGFVKDLI